MKPYILSLALLALAAQASAQTVVKERDGNIMLLNNSVETVVVNTKDASSPAVYNAKVYYLQSNAAVKGKITSYDIATKQYIDVLSVGMKSENGYVIKSEITTMVADTKKGMIYFSTKDAYNGNMYNLTWYYNIADGSYKVFSDGKVSGVDAEGNITILFDGVDEKGKYVRKAHYSVARKLVQTDEKEYL